MNRQILITPKSDACVPRLALRPAEAAIALGICEGKLWELKSRGLISHFCVGTSVRYTVDDLRQFMEDQKKGST